MMETAESRPLVRGDHVWWVQTENWEGIMPQPVLHEYIVTAAGPLRVTITEVGAGGRTTGFTRGQAEQRLSRTLLGAMLDADERLKGDRAAAIERASRADVALSALYEMSVT